MERNYQAPWVQKITYEGEDLDLSFLKACAFIETLDLSGPKLILTFDDREALLREYMGIQPGARLTVTFADDWTDPEASAETVDRFDVVTMPIDEHEVVTLNCFQSDVFGLKTQVIDSRMFVSWPIAAIFRALLPNVRREVGKFPANRTFHLLSGERPSKMLRQLAAEMGARVFYQRGALCAQKLSEMLAAKSAFTYAYNDPRADYKIVHYTRPNADMLLSDAFTKRYCGWSITEGFLQSNNAGPAEWSSADSIAVLDHLADVDSPAIDFVAVGSGALRPGIALDLVWNTARKDAPIDESLPPRVVIGAAGHFYSAQKYLTRIKGVLPL